VSQNRTLMIVLSYLGPLALIPFLMEKEDREIQWHAKHGLVLFGLWLILCVGMFILGQIPILGCLLVLIGPLLGLGYLIVAIIGIMKGVNGQRFIIPGISQYADKF
jgi:uncharacterized membrane protein